MRDPLRGRMGEAITAEYLRRRGYRLLGTNYRSRFGEIDLIAARRGIVAFVEVKLRANAGFAAALEQVGSAKQERIRKTALLWIAEHGEELQPRFDVCEVYLPIGAQEKDARLNYIENAF